MKGIDLANRLLQNIKSSLVLRSQIPYLDTLRELKQGGMYISPEQLNTSSNFGSFDRALREVLMILHEEYSQLLITVEGTPLPLTTIHHELSQQIDLLTSYFDDAIKIKEENTSALLTPAELLLERLETIYLAST